MLNKRFVSRVSSLSEPSEPTPEQVVLLIHADGNIGDTNHLKEYSTFNQTYTTGAAIRHNAQNPFQSQDLSIDISLSNWIDIPNLQFNPRSDDWTFECWINPVGGSGTLFSSFDDKFYIYLTGYSIFISYDYDNLTIAYTTQTNQWKHFVVVSSNGSATVYIDGVSIGSTPTTATGSVARTGYTIGARKAQGYAYNYTGLIRDIRFTKQAVFTSNFPKPTIPTTVLPQTQFLFNIENNIAKNFAQNTICLSATHGVPTLTSGQFNTGLFFNGTTSLKTYSQTNELNVLNSDCTIEMFIRRDANPTIDVFFALIPSTQYVYNIMVGSQNGSIYVWLIGSVTYDTGIPVSMLQTTKHLAITNSNKTIKIYIDGIMKYQFTHTYDLNFDAHLTLGSYQGSYFFTGMIDELRISKDKVVYTADFEPPTLAHTI